MKLTRILFQILLLLFIASCAPTHKISTLAIYKQVLSFPAGHYVNVIQINGKVIGFAFEIGLPIGQQTFFASESDSELTSFIPEVDPACVHYSEFFVIGVLPDGRLGLLKECVDNSGATHFLSTQRSIYAYDWNTHDLERLVEGELPEHSHPGGYAWNPEMTRGVLEVGNWQGTLYWIDRNGATPMDISIKDRGLTWNLKDRAEGMEQAGLANNPAWSPDGQTIAFFATPYGIHELPLPKYNLRLDLFLMDATILEPKLELANVADANQLSWSPNNQYLLFAGCYGSRLTCGLWRYRLSDKSLGLIDEGSFAGFIWITNEKIAAAKGVASYYEDNEIWEYTISE